MAKTNSKDKFTPISLINDFVKLYEKKMKTETLRIGMRSSYLSLLQLLSLKTGVTQLYLAKKALLKPPTVSTTIRLMESDGLVRREADGYDARAVRVYLAEKGAGINKKINSYDIKLTKHIFKDFNEEEQERLTVILQKMKSAIV